VITADRKHLWHRATPANLSFALLGITGVLLLSEHTGWLTFFGQRKGWPPLIACAGAGVAIALILLSLAAGLVCRQRFQFRLRSLLLLVVAVAVPFDWLAVEMRQALKQRELVASLRARRAIVVYDVELAGSDLRLPWEGGTFLSSGAYWPFPSSGTLSTGASPPGPKWLRDIFGGDFFSDVACVSRDRMDEALTDTDLERLELLTRLRELDLVGDGWPPTGITDAGLKRLKGMRQLKALRIGTSNSITDGGLANLRGLTDLRLLSLGSGGVTDAGLEHLIGLSRLRGLDLKGSGVTDAGLLRVRGLYGLEALDIGGTRVTGAGLDCLAELRGLKSLGLDKMRITAEALKNLEALDRLTELSLCSSTITDAGLTHVRPLRGLRYLDLRDTQITDAGLASLARMENLKSLDLLFTYVTDEGADWLQKALPKCQISHRYRCDIRLDAAQENCKMEKGQGAEVPGRERAAGSASIAFGAVGVLAGQLFFSADAEPSELGSSPSGWYLVDLPSGEVRGGASVAGAKDGRPPADAQGTAFSPRRLRRWRSAAGFFWLLATTHSLFGEGLPDRLQGNPIEVRLRQAIEAELPPAVAFQPCPERFILLGDLAPCADILPLTPNRVLFFELSNGRISMDAYVFHWECDDPKESRASGIWDHAVEHLGEFAVPFFESFHVAADDGSYFFVTDSGAVYAAEQTGEEWKTRQVWNDSARPVIAMLTLPDGAGAFLFGKDFYFKAGKSMQPKPCRDVTKGQRAFSRRVNLLSDCGMILSENRELGPSTAAK
jgi:hypothetical protein